MLNTFAVNIIPENEEKRLEALHRYKILDTAPEETFNTLAHLISDVFEVPVALISIVDEEKVFFKGNIGMENVRQVQRGISLCSLAVLSNEPTIITNALEDSCLSANPLVHGEFGLRFYAGAPLITKDGYNIGTVCIVDKKSRSFSERDKNRLVQFSKAAMHAIEARLRSIQQLEAEQEIKVKNKNLEDLNKEFEFVLNTIPQLAWSRTGDGKPAYMNEMSVNYLGTDKDYLYHNDIFTCVHPADKEKVKLAWQRAIQTGTIYEAEYRLKKYDGEYRWFLGRGVPMKDNEGQIVKWYGTSTDIHEQKLISEDLERRVKDRTDDLERQRSLLENILRHSPSGITVYSAIRDAAGNIIDLQCILANNAAERFTGIPLKERLDKTLLQQEPMLKESALFKQAVNTMEAGTPFRSEYFYRPIESWLELSVVKMDDNHLINVFRDITPIKKVNEQLKQHIDELQAANTELEHFAYAASHDLKEPIRKIHIFADYLKLSLANNVTAEQQRYFERMMASAKRMQLLIDDLIAYTYASQANDEELVDLNNILDSVLQDLDLHIEEKEAVIKKENLVTIKGNVRKWQQVFHNLIDNALKYCHPSKPPVIEISCKTVYGDQVMNSSAKLRTNSKYYLIEVSDNGIGFNNEDKERIFSIFQRLHSQEYRGTGLGLSIVKKIVENNNGNIVASSLENKGATFSIYLPTDVVVKKEKVLVE